MERRRSSEGPCFRRETVPSAQAQKQRQKNACGWREKKCVGAYEKRDLLFKVIHRLLSGANQEEKSAILDAILAIVARKHGIFSLLSPGEKKKWFTVALKNLIPDPAAYYAQHAKIKQFAPPNPLTEPLFNVEQIKLYQEAPPELRSRLVRRG